ncbi:MAG: histidine phosphatase family protein [Desulfofustis sp.]|nr:histidine phosphatase family protein [Desulfofustis sp.]
MLLVVAGCRDATATASLDAAWQALRQGEAVALIRHAIAPGIGDPPNFTIGDCATQRTLSEEGRVQSRRIGATFRDRGISEAAVFSSQWCRCLETARLLGFGPVEAVPDLNSFFADRARAAAQTAALRVFIAKLPPQRPSILVTHQVNITALTGIYPASGEIIIVQAGDDGLGAVLGRFVP